MNLVAILSFVLAAQAAQTTVGVAPAPPSPTQVLAKVNGADIKASDVEPYLWDWRGSEVLQDVITDRLIRTEAAKMNISISDAEVAKGFDDQLAKMKSSLPAGQDLDDALHQRGFSRSRLYLRVRSDLLLTGIAEKNFSQKDMVNVSTLLFKPKSAAAGDVADAIKLADQARARLAGGEKWGDVLKSTQQEPQLVQANGQIGWRPISVFPEVTRQEIPALKPGQITKSVQTSAGIQIFKVEAKGDQASPDQMAQLKAQFVQAQRNELIQQFRQNGKVERFYGSAPK